VQLVGSETDDGELAAAGQEPDVEKDEPPGRTARAVKLGLQQGEQVRAARPDQARIGVVTDYIGEVPVVSEQSM
jgi:hypothetical protein